MADPPDLAPDEGSECIVTLHLPPEVLRRGLTTKTKQPRKDGRPRRKKLGRPRNVSIQAQQEAEAARRHREQLRHKDQVQGDEGELDDPKTYYLARNPAGTEGKGEGKKPAKPRVHQAQLYPTTKSQRQAVRENEEALRIWRQNQAPPLRFEADRTHPHDFTSLSPNTVPLHFGSDRQRQLMQGAWETINRVERKFGILHPETYNTSDWQNTGQGRIAVNASQQQSEQQAQKQYHTSASFFQPQPVRPPTTFLSTNRQGFNDPEGHGMPVNIKSTMNTTSSSHTAPRGLSFGSPRSHTAQQQYYTPSSLSRHLPHTHLPPNNPLPYTPPTPYQPQAPTPTHQSVPYPHPFSQRIINGRYDIDDPSYHYAVNMAHNLHFRNPLHPQLDPATKLDYSYLVLNNLRTKQDNSIDPELHLQGGCGELCKMAAREDACAGPSGGVGARSVDRADTMDLDHNCGVGIDDPSIIDGANYDLADIIDFDTGGQSISNGRDRNGEDTTNTVSNTHANFTILNPDLPPHMPQIIPLPAQANTATFKWTTLLTSIRFAAQKMRHARLEHASIRAERCRQIVRGVQWAEESWGPFVQDDEGGGYVVRRMDHSSEVNVEKVIEVGYRRERWFDREAGSGGGSCEEEGDFGQTVGGRGNKDEYDCEYDDCASGRPVRGEAERSVVGENRGWVRGWAEAAGEIGEYGFSVGGGDEVFGMMHVDVEPHVWSGFGMPF